MACKTRIFKFLFSVLVSVEQLKAPPPSPVLFARLKTMINFEAIQKLSEGNRKWVLVFSTPTPIPQFVFLIKRFLCKGCNTQFPPCGTGQSTRRVPVLRPGGTPGRDQALTQGRGRCVGVQLRFSGFDFYDVDVSIPSLFIVCFFPCKGSTPALCDEIFPRPQSCDVLPESNLWNLYEGMDSLTKELKVSFSHPLFQNSIHFFKNFLHIRPMILESRI